jgi:hypothetical protein
MDKFPGYVQSEVQTNGKREKPAPQSEIQAEDLAKKIQAKLDDTGFSNDTKPHKNTPNYFIHFPFYTTQNQFTKKVEFFRTKVLELDSDWEPWLYNKKPHIEIVALHLTDDQLPIVESILDNLGPTLKETMRGASNIKNKPLRLESKGIGFFPYKGNKKRVQGMRKPANVGYAEFSEMSTAWNAIK